MHEKLAPASISEVRIRDENARIEGRMEDGHSLSINERAHLLSARAIGEVVVWVSPAREAFIYTSPSSKSSTSRGVKNG